MKFEVRVRCDVCGEDRVYKECSSNFVDMDAVLEYIDFAFMDGKVLCSYCRDKYIALKERQRIERENFLKGG